MNNIKNIRNLARSSILALKPYESARTIGGNGDIWLNANESPFSSDFNLSQYKLHRYPESQSKKVIFNYSNYVKLLPEQILVSRGIDESIELLIRTFCEPGKDTIIYCPPTYDMYKVSAEISGVEALIVPTLQNWQLDIFKIRENLKKTKIIYICSPNNPTGNVICSKDIQTLLNETYYRSLIVIDEAYIEFIPQTSLVSWIEKYPNLVVLRTLSKAFGLAGIRCGFTLANKEIIHLLSKVIAPYPLSVPVIDIAVKALNKEGIFLMKQRVLQLNNNRDWLFLKLKAIPFIKQVFPSTANYLLIESNYAQKIFKILWDQGIILRDQSNKFNLNGYIRISIGTLDECQRLVDTLELLSDILK